MNFNWTDFLSDVWQNLKKVEQMWKFSAFHKKAVKKKKAINELSFNLTFSTWQITARAVELFSLEACLQKAEKLLNCIYLSGENHNFHPSAKRFFYILSRSRFRSLDYYGNHVVSFPRYLFLVFPITALYSIYPETPGDLKSHKRFITENVFWLINSLNFWFPSNLCFDVSSLYILSISSFAGPATAFRCEV